MPILLPTSVQYISLVEVYEENSFSPNYGLSKGKNVTMFIDNCG
jgi:hypothetical protein